MFRARPASLATGLRGFGLLGNQHARTVISIPGISGGAVANPINVLWFVGSYDLTKMGVLQYRVFYDEVEELSEEERRMLSEIPFDEERYKQAIGVHALKGENERYSTIEAGIVAVRRSMCSGIWGGYTRRGF